MIKRPNLAQRVSEFMPTETVCSPIAPPIAPPIACQLHINQLKFDTVYVLSFLFLQEWGWQKPHQKILCGQ